MRYFFRIFFMFFISVILAIVFNNYADYNFLLVLGSWRIETSIINATLFLVIFHVILYFFFKILLFLLSIKSILYKWRVKKLLNQERNIFRKGLMFFLEDKYVESGEIFSNLLIKGSSYQDKFILFILLAKSNFLTGDYEACLKNLDDSLNYFESEPDCLEAFLVLKIRVMLAKKLPKEALSLLKNLSKLVGDNNLNVLWFSVNINIMLKNYQDVIETSRLLLNRNFKPNSVINKIIDESGSELLRENFNNFNSCNTIWNFFRSQERLLPGISLYFSRFLSSQNNCEESSRILEKSLNNNLDQKLLFEYANNCIDKYIPLRISKIESFLEKDNDNCDLLNALGILCLKYGLWGQAELYLLRSIEVKNNSYAHCLLSILYNHLSRIDDSILHWRQSINFFGLVIPILEKKVSLNSDNDLDQEVVSSSSEYNYGALNDKEAYYDSSSVFFSETSDELKSEKNN